MKRILILENDIRLAIEWVAAFELNHYQVSLCDTVEQALAFLEDTRFDLVVTDLFLDEKEGGLHLLRQISFMTGNAPPVIAVTGARLPNAKSKDSNIFLKSAELLGAKAHIQKPFPAGELLFVAEEIFSKR